MDFEGAFIDTENFTLTDKKLGEGSFGVVYIAESVEDQQKYAAKLIDPSHLTKGSDQLSLIRESSILHKLNHPAIVKFVGINFHSFDDTRKFSPVIITEYLSHGSLKDILDKCKAKKPPQEWNGTKKYINLLGICDAMRYLHKQGILHRDLKPLNVLIDSDYYPRVCDFGLSKCFSKSLSQGMQVSMTGQIGSPIYMAPELFEDEHGHFGTGIDMYAFAILMYEVVTEVTPFMENGKSIGLMTLSRKLSNGERPKITSNVTEKMKQLLNRCWSGNPDERPSFKEVFELLSSDPTYINDPINKEEVDKYVNMLKEARKSSEKKDKKRKESSSRHKKERSKSKDKKKKEDNSVKLSSLVIDVLYNTRGKRIGHGCFGKVYETTLPEEKDRPEMKCAIKVIEQDTFDKKKFFKEIECQASMKHNAIMPLVGFSVPSGEDNNFSILTPFMPNGSLREKLNKVKQSQAPENWETIKAFVVFGVAAGMAYMHQHGIFYKDLKPDNILFDENFHPKIYNFGVIEYLKLGETMPSDQIGTLPYMPPEAFNESNISHKYDVYSYSKILYELLIGKPPYSNRPFEIAAQVLRGERPPINDGEIPNCYKALITQCWAQEPDERPSSLEIIKQLLDNKKEFFNFDLVDEQEFDEYVEQAIQGIDLS